MVFKDRTTEPQALQQPEHISYFSAHHANGRQAASNTPGFKTSHHTAPNFVTPQANNTLSLPGAAEHKPPMVYKTIGSLASFNQLKQFRRKG
jgi:hypothetical protein